MTVAWQSAVERLSRRRVDTATLIGCAFSFASLGVAQKYAGTAASLLVLAIAPLFGIAIVGVFDVAGTRLTARHAELAAAGVLALALLALVVVYPHANTHQPNQGSDRDDAATIGARGFLHGRNPYGSYTYLHNPISQLPTLLVLAMPFVALFGSSAYELVLWLPLLYLLWRNLTGDARLALAALLVALASPGLLREYLTGGDLIPNTVLVAGACALVWRWRDHERLLVPAGALTGIALASRANFVYLLLPLLVAVGRSRGVAAAVRVGVPAALAFAGLVVPLALTTGGRSALTMNDKLSEIPGGAPLILGLTAVIALTLAAGTRRFTLGTIFGQAAFVQILFLVAVVLNTSAETGHPDFFWLISGYGVPALLLALTAVALSGSRSAGDTPRSRRPRAAPGAPA